MEIICELCGAVIHEPDWKTIRYGEIEHTYFKCPACGELFRFSTTDRKLRRNIEKYTEMASRLKKEKCSETFHRRVQKLKEENVRRSRELAKAHPLAPLFMEK